MFIYIYVLRPEARNERLDMNGNTDLIGGKAVSKRLRLRFGTLVLKKND